MALMIFILVGRNNANVLVKEQIVKAFIASLMVYSFTLRIVFFPVLLLNLKMVMVKVVPVIANIQTQVLHQAQNRGFTTKSTHDV